MNLTKRLLDAAQPGEKDVFLWDEEVRGLGVRIKPSGAKTFVLQYRTRVGRSRRISLGKFGVLTLDQARQRARKLLVEVADGGDPAAARRADLKAEDVSALLDRYLAEHVALHNRPSTQAAVRLLVENCIKPALGKLKAKTLTPDDVRTFHLALRSTPRQANLCLAVLSKACGLAETWNIRPPRSNPVYGIQRYAERKRTRFLSLEELARLGQVLDQVEHEKTAPPAAIAVIRLLALSGRSCP